MTVLSSMNLITRVASRFLRTSSGWVDVSSRREAYLDVVWGMYETSYRSIGMHLPSASALLKYTYWEIHMNTEGQPDAFWFAEPTTRGFKLGLTGSDGSPSGKSAVKQQLSQKFHKLGWYGEVSHAIEAIAVKGGAPTVCNVFVEEVLKKPIEPDLNGVHYFRNLGNVGKVKKRMVGNPRGVHTTSSENPSCPRPTQTQSESSVRVASSDDYDVAEHVGCMLDLDLE